MKFLEKVKNMFTEEVEDDEEVEVEAEPVKKEVTHVPIKSPVREEKEKEEDLVEEFKYMSVKKESKPVFFDDDDFDDLNIVRKPKVEEKRREFKEKETRISKPKEEIKEYKEEKKIFKPTPIISPVYGILDKNYHKEDIVTREDAKAKAIEESPIDTIRNKAYGTLEDELENTLFGANSVLFRKDAEQENNDVPAIEDKSLEDFTADLSKELDDIIVKKEKKTSNSKRETSDEKKDEDEDLLGFIDSTLYKNGDE